MYGHNSTAFPRAPDFQYHHGSHAALPVPYHHDHLVSAEFSNSCSSGSSSYVASPISNGAHECYGEPDPNMIQRSVSTCGTHKLVSDLLESETGHVRRVCSTGDLDLQQLQYGGYNRSSSESSSLSSESSMIIEGMSKACRYSPEEKKERIERYRSKRNQRNFNKTIKYACRKTLADSRPRIRGRFARNDEIEKSPNVQWSKMSGEEDEEEDDSWINLLDAFSSIESNSVI
ncbi:zinc finger protein CONSTANS-LIKE 4 isoform X2 [Pyrus x bretschneideri]|uniref:zinc finger protein CONSTANS-LIKE 4 isoform X2 n=1 Tax=Pyrus x bretschneideri TaxID=225117 RepID=UPI00202F39CD|nr:zinc finger protein CONSTANS-LIKE 4 isoform X2 [Pyrus x bretschneideri]